MSAVQTLINEVSQKIHALEIAQALYSRQLSPALASSRQLSPALARL